MFPWPQGLCSSKLFVNGIRAREENKFSAVPAKIFSGSFLFVVLDQGEDIVAG